MDAEGAGGVAVLAASVVGGGVLATGAARCRDVEGRNGRRRGRRHDGGLGRPRRRGGDCRRRRSRLRGDAQGDVGRPGPGSRSKWSRRGSGSRPRWQRGPRPPHRPRRHRSREPGRRVAGPRSDRVGRCPGPGGSPGGPPVGPGAGAGMGRGRSVRVVPGPASARARPGFPTSGPPRGSRHRRTDSSTSGPEPRPTAAGIRRTTGISRSRPRGVPPFSGPTTERTRGAGLTRADLLIPPVNVTFLTRHFVTLAG